MINKSGQSHIRNELNILGALYYGSLPKPLGLLEREIGVSRPKGSSLF